MIALRPIDAVSEPGYPAWELREPPDASLARRAVATATVTLALCFGGCSAEGHHDDTPEHVMTNGSGPDEASKTVPEVRTAGTGVDVGRTMDASTLGLPLALGLSAEERAPRRSATKSPFTQSPTSSSAPLPVYIAMADKPKDDEHIQDNDVVRPKVRPKIRKIRMSGCSRMTSRRRR